jgi:hypothetical protein
VELPISFGHGVGWTRTVSREEVEFTTAAYLVAGERISGSVHFAEDRIGDAVLRYVAVVQFTRPGNRDGELLEVHARFEHLQFTAEN